MVKVDKGFAFLCEAFSFIPIKVAYLYPITRYILYKFLYFYIVNYIYTQNPDSNIPIMLIDKHIGIDENGNSGVIGSDFLRELISLENQGKTNVEIWINSIGGAVLDGWSIYGGITNSKMNITTVNIGICASTAGWLFEAGHNRIMLDYSVLMMHMPHGGTDAGKDEISNSIATMLANKSNKSIEQIRNMMEETTFMDALEAKQNGLCDEIRESINVNIPTRKSFKAIRNEYDAWKEGTLMLNQLLPNNTKMTEVANILGLNAEANESAIVESITELKNQATNYAELARKYDEMQGEYNAMMAKCNEMQEQLNAMAKAKEELENSTKLMEATNVVTKFAEIGAIKNEAETIELWVNNALKLGVQEVSKILEDLPVNKMAPSGVNNITSGKSSVATTVEEYKNKFQTKA